jgi:hypothetical protein
MLSHSGLVWVSGVWRQRRLATLPPLVRFPGVGNNHELEERTPLLPQFGPVMDGRDPGLTMLPGQAFFRTLNRRFLVLQAVKMSIKAGGIADQLLMGAAGH